MAEIKTCNRNNMCYECDNEKCWHSGKKYADCPKYDCDNPNGLFDCDHCAFFDEFEAMVHDASACMTPCTEYDQSSTEYDQSLKADAGKARLTLVLQEIIWAIARIREFGVNKYHTTEGWQNVEVERYRDAAYRHFLHYLKNPHGLDEESGLPSLWHLCCNLAFLCALEDKYFRPEGESNASEGHS